MSSKVKLVCTISKEALKLIEKKQAKSGPGGVRATTGELLELTRPAVLGVGNGFTSPVSLISSLAGNVQNEIVRRGVNQANSKLDMSLEKMDQINDSVNKLLTKGSWNWVGNTIGLANCGISLVGFYMTLQKIDSIKSQIEQFASEYQRNIMSDKTDKAQVLELELKEDIEILQDRQTYVDERVITQHLHETTVFLKRLISDTLGDAIDKEVAYCLIYRISIIHAQVIRLYSALHYYDRGKTPGSLDQWLEPLDIINGENFRKKLKVFLWYQCPDITMEQKNIVYESSTYSEEYALGNIAYALKMVKTIDKNQYLNLNDYLLNKIQLKEYTEQEKFIAIEMG